MPHVNPNLVQGWQHDLAGAAQAVHADVGLNANQMAAAQEELAAPNHLAANNNVDGEWAQWADQEVHLEEQQDDNDEMIIEDVQQQEISFDQSGSTAQYLRANGPDITLNIADVLAGRVSGSSSSSSDSSNVVNSLGVQLPVVLQSLERVAFDNLITATLPPQLQIPIVLDRVDLNIVANITKGMQLN